MREDIIEIRWHGRGGQGAITAAKIVANAAFVSGYKGVVMAPTFGTERRGAPIFTSLKISKNKIYDLSPITTPDMVVVLDHSLLSEVDVVADRRIEVDESDVGVREPDQVIAHRHGVDPIDVLG